MTESQRSLLRMFWARANTSLSGMDSWYIRKIITVKVEFSISLIIRTTRIWCINLRGFVPCFTQQLFSHYLYHYRHPKKKNHRIEGNKLLGHIYKGSPQAKELNPGNRKELHETVKNTNEGNRPIRWKWEYEFSTWKIVWQRNRRCGSSSNST